MQLIYASGQNGGLTFADPENISHTLQLLAPRKRTNKFGTTISRRIEEHQVLQLLPNASCEDQCTVAPYGEYFKLESSNLAPRNATEHAALKSRLNAFFANVLLAVDNNYFTGFNVSTDTVFTGTVEPVAGG